jgi:hypothetical protein
VDSRELAQGRHRRSENPFSFLSFAWNVHLEAATSSPWTIVGLYPNPKSKPKIKTVSFAGYSTTSWMIANVPTFPEGHNRSMVADLMLRRCFGQREGARRKGIHHTRPASGVNPFLFVLRGWIDLNLALRWNIVYVPCGVKSETAC